MRGEGLCDGCCGASPTTGVKLGVIAPCAGQQRWYTSCQSDGELSFINSYLAFRNRNPFLGTKISYNFEILGSAPKRHPRMAPS
jgi:hypothetical protein